MVEVYMFCVSSHEYTSILVCIQVSVEKKNRPNTSTDIFYQSISY